jgi:flagellin
VIDNIDVALDTINSERATLGASQSRFEAVISQPADLGGEPVRRPQPDHGRRLRVETANLSRAQILQQAGNAMVAQANQMPQQVLQLLG